MEYNGAQPSAGGAGGRRRSRSDGDGAAHDIAVHDAPVPGHVVVGDGPMQQTAIVPQHEVAGLPTMRIDEVRRGSCAGAAGRAARGPPPSRALGSARHDCRDRAPWRRCRDGCAPAGGRPYAIRAVRSRQRRRGSRRSDAARPSRARRSRGRYWQTRCRRPREATRPHGASSSAAARGNRACRCASG